MFDFMMRALTNAAFRFVVTVDGVPVGAFTECTPPTLELEMEELKEGGLNTHVHQLPGRRKSSTVTLKNGVGLMNHLLPWYAKVMNGEVSRRRVNITLLGPTFIPVMVWDIEDAYPVKWSGPTLKSDENGIAIEELQLACGAITVV